MKNKILAISIILLLSFIFISSNVYASETGYVSPPDKIIEELESKEYYNNPDYDYLVYKWNSNYSILFVEKTDTLKFYTYIGNHVYINANEAFNGYLFTYDSSYTLTSSEEVVNATWRDRNCGFIDNNVGVSSMNIYTDNTFTEIFFQGSPVTEPATELAPILEKVEMMEPIITTIVGLAKLLIPLLICLLGFWKAWRLLLKIFHKS